MTEKIEIHEYKFVLEFTTNNALSHAEKTELRCNLHDAINKFNAKIKRMNHFCIDFTEYRCRRMTHENCET